MQIGYGQKAGTETDASLIPYYIQVTRLFFKHFRRQTTARGDVFFIHAFPCFSAIDLLTDLPPVIWTV